MNEIKGESRLLIDSRTINIVIEDGHVAVVDRVVRTVEDNWNHWRAAHLPGVHFDQKGDVHFPAGLVAHMVAELERDGYRVAIDDRREDVLDVENAVIESAEGADRRYLESVAGNRIGTVEIQGHKELITRLVQFMALYPDAELVVAVPTRKLAWKVREALQAALGHPVGMITAKTQRPGKQCIVCTYRSLNKVKGRQRAMLAIVEAERAIHVVGNHTTGKRAFPRVYGFVYAGVTRHENADLGLKAIAGDVIHSVASTAARARVLMITPPTTPTTPMKPGGRGLKRKRQTLWGNRPRNRLAAQVAIAFHDGDLAALHKHGVHVDQKELSGLHKIAVLVESTAHAKQLRSLLKGWLIYSKVPLELRPAITEKETGTEDSRGFIATITYAAFEGLDADVIVRLTGGHGEWLVGELYDGVMGNQRPATLVIDFRDIFDRQARNDTHHRVNDYRKKGWAIEGINLM